MLGYEPMRNGTTWLSLLVAILLAGGLACSTPAVHDTTFVPAEPGVLRVATSLPAPGFWNGSSPETVSGGYEYAIARALAQRWQLRLEIVDVPFGRIVAGDLAGADLALAQIAVTPERSRVLALSVPYLPANMGVLAPAGGAIQDLASARAQRWVVEDGTTELDFLRRIVRPAHEPTIVPSRDQTLQVLADHGADAALLDLPTALATAHQSGGRLAVPGQFVSDQQLAAALPRGSSNLEPLNAVLRNLTAAGRLASFEQAELIPVLGRDPARVPVIVARTAA